MPGAGCTRGLVCLCAQQETHTSIQVQPRHPGIPCAMVLTVSFVLSLGTGLCCPHRPRDARHHRELDASVGAPGPHDFSVRVRSTFVARGQRVHRSPAPRFVTIGRSAPLAGTG